MQTTVEISTDIMIVDDDNIISTLLQHLLQRRGYETQIVKDGRMASELIDKMSAPKLVILDVMLPFMDGFELIKLIREKDDWKDVPVIMLTSKAQEKDIVRALDAGANDYIVKPFQPQELMARVRRFLR